MAGQILNVKQAWARQLQVELAHAWKLLFWQCYGRHIDAPHWDDVA